jgi:hypothetical protein
LGVERAVQESSLVEGPRFWAPYSLTSRCGPEDLNVSEFAELLCIQSLNIGVGHVLEKCLFVKVVVIRRSLFEHSQVGRLCLA